jgi:hypothetical protein
MALKLEIKGIIHNQGAVYYKLKFLQKWCKTGIEGTGSLNILLTRYPNCIIPILGQEAK